MDNEKILRLYTNGYLILSARLLCELCVKKCKIELAKDETDDKQYTEYQKGQLDIMEQMFDIIDTVDSALKIKRNQIEE